MSLKQIAEQAGVSISTVSRILNDPEHRCADDGTRKKVWDIARRLQYVPNESARRLKMGAETKDRKIFYLDVLMTRTTPEETDAFFGELLRMIESEIHKNQCILASVWHESVFSDDRRCRTENIAQTIEKMAGERETRLDGLIILGKCNADALKQLKRRYKAVVSVSRNSVHYAVDEVICDGRRIASLAVEYLIGLGHRRIGYVGECRNEARYEGYQAALFRHNLIPDISTVIEARHTEADGCAVLEKLAQLPDPATAIYCATDSIGIGMLKYLSQSRNRYYTPSIIASDDIDAAQFTRPMLTTVHIPKEEMARCAVHLIIDRIRGGHTSPIRIEFDGTLMVRQSCAPVSESFVPEYYI